MADWLKSMQQTFEYYIVDPGTWKDSKKLDFVKSSTINRDLSAETLGSASFEVDEDLGECYIRVYLVTIQNGITEKHPLGTFLVQTPSYSFDGKTKSTSLDAFTPLIELKENQPPTGYFIPKGSNIMQQAKIVYFGKARAPIVETGSDKTLNYDFVANQNDTWLTYISDLIGSVKYRFDLDELSRVMFSPIQDIDSLQPIWTYNDDNSSILYPDITMQQDLYGIPNSVEVIFTNSAYVAVADNEDINSPVSRPNRGRKIVYRITDPEITGNPTREQMDKYAEDLLKQLSTLEYSISYSHGYCPVRLGDCVRLNYERAGLSNVKAKVISQSIDCSAGCKVTETAVFTKKLWG